MRQGHDNLLTGGAFEGVLRVGRRGLWLVFAILFLATSMRPAEGQFSGPALGASTVVNPPVTITTDPAILYPVNRDVYLGRGDVISIRLYGSADYTPTSRIDLDGVVQLPLIGPQKVDGLTLHQAQDLIAQKLISAGMYRDPQVSILIVESPNQIAT